MKNKNKILSLILILLGLMYSCSNDNNIIIKKYDSGTIMSVVNLKNGVRDGYSYYYYYPNGYIKSIEYYKNDTANGDFVSFDEDGQLEGL